MKTKVGIIILLCIFTVSLFTQTARADSIEWVGNYDTPGYAWGVVVVDTLAYVADNSSLQIVNISEPTIPSFVGSCLTVGADDRLYVSGSYVYLAENVNGLQIVDISDPAAPALKGRYDVPPFHAAFDVQVIDTLAYIADYYDFLILNVSDPDTIKFVGNYDTPGLAYGIYVIDSLAYLADYDSLLIFDVSNPIAPTRIGACSMPRSAVHIFVRDTLAYLACLSPWGYEDGRLYIVNVSDPTAPFIVNSCHTPGDPWGVYVLGDYAYVAAADWYSMSRDTKPQLLRVNKHNPVFSTFSGISPADIEGGLRIVNISNPNDPVLAASYDTPGDPHGVFTEGDLVYIGDWDYDGLVILRHIINGGQEEKDLDNRYCAKLFQNYPNPFHTNTVIRYQLPEKDRVSLKICDVTGRIMRVLVDGTKREGSYSVIWDGTDNVGKRVTNGMYFCQFTIGEATFTKKLIVLK